MAGRCQNSEAVGQRCSVKDVFRNFAKFTGKHLRQSFFYTAFSIPPLNLTPNLSFEPRFLVFIINVYD